MQQIFVRVASGDSMKQIVRDLTAAGVPTPSGGQGWQSSLLTKMIRNSAYKGEFISHCKEAFSIDVPTQDGRSTRKAKRFRKRPSAEWIIVPCASIVDAALWQDANDVLAKNRQMAARNGKVPYLLTGLMKCSLCGFAYVGWTGYSKRKNGSLSAPFRAYQCRASSDTAKHDCPHRFKIAANIIEPAVWRVVCEALLKPKLLLTALEANTFDERSAQVGQQIAYLERELVAKQAEDDKLYKAYVAEVFDEVEFRERRVRLKDEVARLQSERDKLLPKRVSIEQFEAQKAMVMQFSAQLKGMSVDVTEITESVPFELKQRMMKLMVDKISLNGREGWFQLEGIMRGTHHIANNFAYENRQPR